MVEVWLIEERSSGYQKGNFGQLSPNIDVVGADEFVG